MKHYLSLALRVVLAIAGVAYIAWNVDWVDRVEVRAGAVVAGQELLLNGKPITGTKYLRVVSGEVDPKGQKQDLKVVDDASPGSPPLLILAADANASDKIIVRASFITTMRHARKGLLLIGLLMVAPVYPITGYRWMLLMRARGLEITFAKAMKLTMVGCFFNYCMPGATGGDVVKAYYAAARSDRRTDAVMSVIFDRVVGVLGLVLLAGLAGLFALQHELARSIVVKVWICAAIGSAGACVYFSHQLRRMFRLDRLIARLPAREFLAKIDNAAVAYGKHPGTIVAAVLMSVPVHLLIASSAATAGYALGMTTGFGLLLTVLPIIFLSGALPITPQGAGVWEALGKAMLVPTLTASMNQIVAMLVLIRVYQLAYSLSGGFYLLKGDIHLHPERDAVKA